MHRKILLFLLIIQLALLSPLFSQSAEQLRANLYSLNTDSTLSLDDGNLTMYNINNSNAVDGGDAVKMPNFGENFGLLRGAATLAIERRKSITTTDTIFFSMWNMQQKSYKLVFLPVGLEQLGLMAILEDKYLHTSAELALNGASSSVFTITDDTASAAPDRFRIILFSPSSFKALPLTFTDIKAYENVFPGRPGKSINLEWNVENESNTARYQVEKSVDGQNFYTLSAVCLNGKGSGHYTWIDSSALPGNNFYRVKSIDLGGISYSSTIKLSVGLDHLVSVFPNPVVNGLINIQLTGQPKGVYIVRLINKSGQVVHSAQLNHTGMSSSQTLQLNKNVHRGDYFLELVTPIHTTITRKILLQ